MNRDLAAYFLGLLGEQVRFSEILDTAERLYEDVLVTRWKDSSSVSVPTRIHIDCPLSDQKIDLTLSTITVKKEI